MENAIRSLLGPGVRRKRHQKGAALASAVCGSALILLILAGGASANENSLNGCRAATGAEPVGAGRSEYTNAGYAYTCSYTATGPGVYEGHAAYGIWWDVYVNGSKVVSNRRADAGTLPTKSGDVVKLRVGYGLSPTVHVPTPYICLARGWCIAGVFVYAPRAGSVTAYDQPSQGSDPEPTPDPPPDPEPSPPPDPEPSPPPNPEPTPTPADTTPPDTVIDSGPFGTVSSTDATFEFHASEADSTFECSLDGAAFGSCTSPTKYSGLAVGSHTFQVKATDQAGNPGTPAAREWTVVQPPTAPQNLGASTATKGKGVELSWSVPESDGNSAITGYRIYRATSSGAQTFLAAVGSVTSYKDQTTKSGQTYYYRASAVNDVGEGPFSNEGSARAR